MSRIFIGILILFSLFGCTEYQKHHAAVTAVYDEGEYIYSSGSNPQISVLPDVHFSDTIVSQFDAAKRRIWVEIYIWTERDSIDALIRAHRRGLDVRVILEGNVYATPWINNSMYQKLQDAGVPVFYADNEKYRFTHAKFWIIDDSYCVSTGNLTYTSFQKNRDIVVCDSQNEILSVLETIYQSDIKKEFPVFSGPIPLNIGISPINMRSRILSTLKNAHKSIFVYVQNISDAEVLGVLQEKKEQGLEVKVCVAKNDSSNSFSGLSFPIAYVKKPYLHAKAILIDGSLTLLGSVNLTENGIDNNREVALFYQNNEIVYSQIEKYFNQDCHYE